MGALAVTIPIIIYNVIMFVRPAFEKALPKRRVYLTTLFSALLAFAGAAFGFLVIVPGALQFFAGFQVDGLSALISADAYLGFVTNVIITFILVFQLPLLIAFIDTIKPLTPRKLFAAEKWVILGSLVISFLVPFALDITTSLLIAAPIVGLYNISIIIVLLRHAQQRYRECAAQQATFNVSRIPSSSLALSELSFEDIIGSEAVTPAPIAPPVPLVSESLTQLASRPVMDIRTVRSRPAPVVPAEWVHRVHEQITLNPRAKVISDIQPRTRTA